VPKHFLWDLITATANPVRQRYFFVFTQYKDDSDILGHCPFAIAKFRFSSKNLFCADGNKPSIYFDHFGSVQIIYEDVQSAKFLL